MDWRTIDLIVAENAKLKKQVDELMKAVTLMIVGIRPKHLRKKYIMSMVDDLNALLAEESE